MTTQSYNKNEEIREDAVHQIEDMMRSSKMVRPRFGFTTRWMKRYRRENIKLMRRQAAIFVLINSIIAFALLGVIGWIYFYGTNSFNGVIAKLVSQISSSWADVQVIFQVAGSVLRTVPGIIPSAWWISIASLVAIVLIAWSIRIKKSFSESGNKI